MPPAARTTEDDSKDRDQSGPEIGQAPATEVAPPEVVNEILNPPQPEVDRERKAKVQVARIVPGK